MLGGSRVLSSEALHLLDKAEVDNAKALLLEALRKDSNNHEAYNNLALILINEDLEKAERCLKKAIYIKDDYTDAIYNLANIYKQKGLYNDAITLYKRALQTNPFLYQAYYNIANIYLEKSNYNEAIHFYLKAIELNQNYYQAYSNLGVSYFFLGHIDKSIENYYKSIRIKSDFAEAHFNLGLALLMLGDFKKGWNEYQWRWKLPNFKKIQTDKPEWDGTVIKGKTLFIYAEQGYGDTIQFVRYLHTLQSLDIKIKFACPKALITLIANSFPNIDILDLKEIDKINFDIHCPLLELPRFLTNSIEDIPSHVPYLRPSQDIIERFKELLSNNGKIKVGLIWQGSKDNRRGFYRSIDSRFVESITRLKGINFISLMVDRIDGHSNISDLSGELLDFHHTAGLIANLDLIITIDTSIAHLAGAMGKPVWLMLHYISDWRWMLHRLDSPWYPTMRIFRQHQLDDWRKVIEDVIDELSRLTGQVKDEDIQKDIDLVHAQINWDKALQLLKEGDLKNGWRLYNWRREIKGAKGSYPDLGIIEWTGQDLTDRGILVYDEQGFGDVIQFIRFAGSLLQKCVRLYILCRPELYRLIKTFNQSINVLKRGEDFTVSVDYICPLMSLPFYLNIDKIEKLSYISPYFHIAHKDTIKWQKYLEGHKGLKIGIAIESRKGQVYSEKKSIPISLFSNILTIENVAFYNIQKTDNLEIKTVINDYSNYFSDFYDTASFIMNLDLIISVDTASAHLAGALGKDTWLMLPFDSDWRWFNDTDWTVWYPTMRIFKQTQQGDWQGVLEKIKGALRQITNER